MGVFWNGLKTDFAEIDHLKTRINEIDFWCELNGHSSSSEIDFTIKSTKLIRYTEPIEYGTNYLSVEEKKFYNTFFFHTNWTTFGEEDEIFIDRIKYTVSPSNDDLGWLKLDPTFYWKALNTKTLSRIINDFKKVNFALIQEKYELERAESIKQFSSYPDFDYSKYRIEAKETFANFVILTKQIIEIYKDCVLEEKDLMIFFD